MRFVDWHFLICDTPQPIEKTLTAENAEDSRSTLSDLGLQAAKATRSAISR